MSGYKMTEVGEIPEDWDIVKVGDYTSSFAGGTPLRSNSAYYNGNIPWVKSGEVNQRNIIRTEEQITSKAVAESAAKIIAENSVLVALYGATAGNVGMLRIKAASNQAVLGINSKVHNLDNEFIYYYLKTATIKLLSLTQGSGQPNLSKGIIDSLKIPLPSLQEQQKIAAILSTVDDKIEVIEEQISKTQELKKGLMQQLLTKGIGHTQFKDSALGQIPVSWEVVKLGDVVDKVGSGITPKGGNETYLTEGVMFLRSQNILSGRMNLSDVAYISDQQHQKMNGSRVYSGDVLLNITGASIGRSCVVPQTINDANVNQHVCIIRSNGALNSEYLCQYLNSYLGQNQIDKFQTTGNRQGLNYQQIRSFLVPFPSMEEQGNISSILSSLDEKLEVLVEKKTIYQEMKKGLMQQLLTGKLRVNSTL